MKLAAAKAIAASVPEEFLQVDYIIPTIFDSSVTQNGARSVRDAAIAIGVAQRKLVVEMNQESSNEWNFKIYYNKLLCFIILKKILEINNHFS